MDSVVEGSQLSQTVQAQFAGTFPSTVACFDTKYLISPGT